MRKKELWFPLASPLVDKVRSCTVQHDRLLIPLMMEAARDSRVCLRATIAHEV